jgi:hypothetical protein
MKNLIFLALFLISFSVFSQTTIVQRNKEISQAITLNNGGPHPLEVNITKPLAPLEKRNVYTRATGPGMINAVYLLTDTDLVNMEIGMDEQYGINNCAYDLWHIQGETTRDNGILFCKTYDKGHYEKRDWPWEKKVWIPASNYSLIYESAYGMRYNHKLEITLINLSKDKPATIRSIMILYATVCD